MIELGRRAELPIHAHRNGWGYLSRYPSLGWSYTAWQKFWRLATKKQRKPPATMAIAHTLLVLCYQVLKSGRPYKERGLPVMDQNQRKRLISHHVRRLGKLGIRVRSLALAEALDA